MTLINCLYYFCLLLIFHTKNISTYQCHQCASQVFNHQVTIDTLTSPTEDDCNIVTTVHGCYVHINWLADGTSEIYYKTDPALPYDSILATGERQVNLHTGKYSTRRSIGYSCRSNTTACNTIDNLKRAIISTTFPTEEQIKKFDTLITPTKNFNSRLCSLVSNMTKCPNTDLIKCQQCMSIVQYSSDTHICSTCPIGNVTSNFFSYHIITLLNMKSQSERITIGCQKHDACNSIENIEEIKRTLSIKLDLKRFHRSTASITKSSVILLFIVVFTDLFRSIDQYYS